MSVGQRVTAIPQNAFKASRASNPLGLEWQSLRGNSAAAGLPPSSHNVTLHAAALFARQARSAGQSAYNTRYVLRPLRACAAPRPGFSPALSAFMLVRRLPTPQAFWSGAAHRTRAGGRPMAFALARRLSMPLVSRCGGGLCRIARPAASSGTTSVTSNATPSPTRTCSSWPAHRMRFDLGGHLNQLHNTAACCRGKSSPEQHVRVAFRAPTDSRLSCKRSPASPIA